MMNIKNYVRILMPFLIILILISTVAALTKLQYRQFNTNARDHNLTNLTFFDAENGTMIKLNVTILHAADRITLQGNDLVAAGGLFNNQNFTVLYDGRLDRWSITNYSTEYSLTGYQNSNYSDEYASTGFNLANFSLQIAVYDTLYKTGNITLDFPNIDKSLLDDWNFANNLSGLTNALTFNGVISFNSDVLFFDNVSFVNLGRINTSILCAIDGSCDIGNNSNRFRHGNFTGTIQAVTFSDGTATLTGGVLTATRATLSGNDAQTVNAVYKDSNFTADLNNRNGTLGQWQKDGSDLITNDLTLRINVSQDMAIGRRIQVNDYINHTLNGTVRHFFNGCFEFANDTGIHIIC